MTFSKVEDDEYTSPKDRIPFKQNDSRTDKYYIDPERKRYVFLNKEAADSFIHPNRMEEDEWQQAADCVEKEARTHRKPNFYDNMSEWEEFPENLKPDKGIIVEKSLKATKLVDLFTK